jgi:hypothetical protein
VHVWVLHLVAKRNGPLEKVRGEASVDTGIYLLLLLLRINVKYAAD